MRFLSPSGIPSFSRSPSVKSDNTSLSIAFSMNTGAYCPNPIFRSHAPTSMVAPLISPRAKMKRCAFSFDHLVGAGEKRRWYFEAEGLCGAEIDHQLEFGRLQHRQVGRLGAADDATNINANLATRGHKARPGTHQPARFGIVAHAIGGGNRIASGHNGKVDASAVEECIGPDKEGVDALMAESREGRIDLLNCAGVENADL